MPKETQHLTRDIRKALERLEERHELLFRNEIETNEIKVCQAEQLSKRMTKGCRFCDSNEFKPVAVQHAGGVLAVSIACTNCGGLHGMIYPDAVKDKPKIKIEKSNYRTTEGKTITKTIGYKNLDMQADSSAPSKE